jgi:hypothetical protein
MLIICPCPQNPAGRLGTESEVSAAVVFLLSDAAAYISGTCLRVDGASSLLKGGDRMDGKARSISDLTHHHPGESPFFNTESKIQAFMGFPTVDCALGASAPAETKALLASYTTPSRSHL